MRWVRPQRRLFLPGLSWENQGQTKWGSFGTLHQSLKKLLVTFGLAVQGSSPALHKVLGSLSLFHSVFMINFYSDPVL